MPIYACGATVMKWLLFERERLRTETLAVKIILNRAKQYFIKFGFQLYTASDINSITIGKHTGISIDVGKFVAEL